MHGSTAYQPVGSYESYEIKVEAEVPPSFLEPTSLYLRESTSSGIDYINSFEELIQCRGLVEGTSITNTIA